MLPNWRLVICSLTLRYQTHISPIPNWIYYPQLGNLLSPMGDNMSDWGYFLLLLYFARFAPIQEFLRYFCFSFLAATKGFKGLKLVMKCESPSHWCTLRVSNTEWGEGGQGHFRTMSKRMTFFGADHTKSGACPQTP